MTVRHLNIAINLAAKHQAVELGATEAVQQHMSRHVVATKPVSQRKLDFEHKRPRILRECMAEATGVFFYVLERLVFPCTSHKLTLAPLASPA